MQPKEDSTENFGGRLRELRREAGISQRDLALRVQLDFTYISKLENGRLSAPSADTVIRISEALGVDAIHLLSLAGKLPSDIQETMGTSSAAQEFLMEAQRFRVTDAEWALLGQQLRSLREDTF